MATVGRYVKAFGMFWWDFLVGDTPELFVGTLAVIALALGLRHNRAVAVPVVPLVAVAFLYVSTFRARRRA